LAGDSITKFQLLRCMVNDPHNTMCHWTPRARLPAEWHQNSSNG